MNRFLIATLCLVLAACGGGGGTGGIPAPTPAPLPTPGDDRAPRPLTVQVTPDRPRMVEGTLTPDGGTLTATAADGTVFTLTAPANAVFGPLKVRMTPVARLGGLNGAGGYLAAVHLEPKGAEFFEPLTLKIAAPQALKPETLRAFNSHALGADFYFQGRAVEGRTATLRLLHFSNPGVAVIEESDLPVPPVPTSPRDRLENDLALDITKETQLLDRFHAQLGPLLEAALTSDAKLKTATGQFLTWRSEVERLGLSEVYKTQIYQGWKLIAQGIEGAVERAHAECAVNSDLTRLRDIVTWVSWVKRNPRLSPYFNGKMARFEQLARDCARFELEVNSTITMDLGDARFESTVHTNIPLMPAGGETDLPTTLMGHAPLEVRGYRAEIENCTVTPGTPVAQLDVEAELGLAWLDTTAGIPFLDLLPGYNRVPGTIVCKTSNSPVTRDLPDWSSSFSTAHLDECSPEGCYRIEDWQPGVGSVLGTKTYERTVPAAGRVYHEKTTLTLRHAPL
ncbi:hypothetical protein [Deinococcus koreensis]|uniref:Uncharacterized protein n=1 Tax=Deinococcus koreensis TaxID=2054903 RepID=A0A2K3USV0_9DEIO|nr:hypothetical protein [Deinococcus koreensis]PNY79599.1 hypothetical protein CVO96_16655 [Deinococcus koreensis]